MANSGLFSSGGGDRADKPNVLVVITDGKTNSGSKPYSSVLAPLIVSVAVNYDLFIGSLSNHDDDDDNAKKIWFQEQNNSSARASSFLVHFFDVHYTTTTWNLLIRRPVEGVNIRRRIFQAIFETRTSQLQEQSPTFDKL